MGQSCSIPIVHGTAGRKAMPTLLSSHKLPQLLAQGADAAEETTMIAQGLLALTAMTRRAAQQNRTPGVLKLRLMRCSGVTWI